MPAIAAPADPAHLNASVTRPTQPAAASSPPSATRLGRLKQCTGQPEWKQMEFREGRESTVHTQREERRERERKRCRFRASILPVL